MSSTQQTYANHPRFPALYMLAGVAILIAACMRGYLLVRSPSLDTAALFLLAAAVLVLWYCQRVADLTLQNRLIRAEMRARIAGLLGSQRCADADRVTLKQLIALRFACDAQLPELLDEVLAGKLSEPDAIKRKVREWRADHLRV